MLRSVVGMKNYALGARDGRIGQVSEFYFDDDRWTIRYLVARAGSWFTGNLVLLSPHVLGKPDDTLRTVPVDLTTKQVRGSPPPETDKPVSRQFETEYYRYFGWPYYWVGPYTWGSSPFPMSPLGPKESGDFPPEDAWDGKAKGDPHLRSTDEVAGYHIQARDGSIGHVEDFLYDDRNWSIRYLVASTRNWWPGKKVLLPPSWIGNIRWQERIVEADALREDIRRAPEYDTAAGLTPEFESRLEDYYASVSHPA